MKKKSSRVDLPRAFKRATDDYWRWLSAYCAIDEKGKREKAKKMAATGHGFLRGSFYFWRDILREAAPDALESPRLLCVGDIHVENFGSWRDAEGRLVWGVNDFDDCAELPFLSDLVRLLASAVLVAKELGLTGDAVGMLIDCYVRQLKQGGEPYVLEGRHSQLRNLAMARGKHTEEFWKDRRKERKIKIAEIEEGARTRLLAALPEGAELVDTFAPLSGTGSLGRPRYSAVATLQGGYVSREIKAAAPSANDLTRMDAKDPTASYRRMLEHNRFRIPDPHFAIEDRWIVRRISPEARKIEFEDIKRVRGRKTVLAAMGAELANVHLAFATGETLLPYLMKAKLRRAAARAAALVEELRAVL